jgi:ribosome biogenesis protein MAK21
MFKAMRSDSSVARVMAFVRRLLQMSLFNESNYTCASLLVINELLRSRQEIRYSVFTQVAKKTVSIKETKDSDSDEEVFQDVDRIEDENKHAENAVNKAITKKMKIEPYDALKREPQFAHAEGAPIWELVQLARHAHPTVALWSSELLKGELVEYAGDPLLDFGLSNFLDRISFKSPKTEEKVTQHRQRMATFEQPVNEVDLDNVERRKEEEYLYKYVEMKPKKVVSKEHEESYDGSDTDPEMDAFANKEIEDQMKRL